MSTVTRPPAAEISSAANDTPGFPRPCFDHGIEIVKIQVGSARRSQEFSIHENLLCSASPFFQAALKGAFSESKKKMVKLPEHSPDAFQVLYQYLYTGRVMDSSFFTRTGLTYDHLLVLTLKLANFTGIPALTRAVYLRMVDHFPADKNNAPSPQLIDELYKDDNPLPKVTAYIVAHCAWWIARTQRDGEKLWEKLLLSNAKFAQDVSVRMHHYLLTYQINMPKTHPQSESAFAADMVCKIPDSPSKKAK